LYLKISTLVLLQNFTTEPDTLIFDKDDTNINGGDGFDLLSVGSDNNGQLIDMTQPSLQQIEAVVVNANDAQLKVALDKVLLNETDSATNGQFVCSGADSLQLEGFGWELSDNNADLSSELREAYEASNIDADGLFGYTFSNSDGNEVTIWSDSDADKINFNGSEIS
jgi:hypothetical protein